MKYALESFPGRQSLKVLNKTIDLSEALYTYLNPARESKDSGGSSKESDSEKHQVIRYSCQVKQ